MVAHVVVASRVVAASRGEEAFQEVVGEAAGRFREAEGAGHREAGEGSERMMRFLSSPRSGHILVEISKLRILPSSLVSYGGLHLRSYAT